VGSGALSELRELNARAIAIMEAASRQDFSPLRAASASPEESEATVKRIWTTAEQNMGAFRSFDVPGTVPAWWGEAPAPVSFVRLHFERGTRLFRVHWENGRISGFGGFAIPNPARTTLFAQSSSGFIGYNLGIEHPVAMRFEGDVLVIQAQRGELRAVRER
jgi:hypothetical protein